MYFPRTLDPRPGADNSLVLGANTLGIEVTIPALAARCELGNLDPQHTGGDANLAAIEVALIADLPPEGAILVTVRADLDSVGAMAVLASRKIREFDSDAVRRRIQQVADADKFVRRGWPGPKSLPTQENPWPEEGAGVESSRMLAAIAVAVADFNVPLDARVATMQLWLLTGQEPEQYRSQVEIERSHLISALETGQIEIARMANGRVAVVTTTHRAATLVGYSVAPIVLALNPEFRFNGGVPHSKFTICQFVEGYVDLRSAIEGLSRLESGWGGSATIIGSPQGVSSCLSIEVVVGVLEKYLLQ